MDYDEFRALIDRLLEEVPEAFLEGLQGVHVLERVQPDPEESDLVRLGEYLDPGPDSLLGGGGGLGRQVMLYYGSFLAVAGPGFDWEGEAWETLTHELQHHLESRAGDASLIEEDRLRLEAHRARRGS